MSTPLTLERLAQTAHALGRADSPGAQWSCISQMAESVLGYRLLTALVYLKEQRLMRRIFTSDESLSPLGGFKATGKGPWSAHVLDQGLRYVGSTEADLRTVFSEAELLIGRGLGAVLNIPIWCEGQVIGSINLLDREHAYDRVDDAVVNLVAGICAPAFLLARASAAQDVASLDLSTLESV